MLRLSTTTCSCRWGKAATTSFMNLRKITDVRRCLTCAITLPLAISKAASKVCVPWRTYSLVQLRRFLGTQRQQGLSTVQCLNPGLFVDAEHKCIIGRIQVQADDIQEFGLEIGI